LHSGGFEEIRRIEEITGIAISFSQEKINEVGEEFCLQGGFTRYDEMEKEFEVKVALTAEQVKEIGKKIILGYRFSEIEELEKVSDVKITWDQDSSDYLGKEIFLDKKYDNIKEIEGITGFKPRFDQEVLNNEVYKLAVSSSTFVESIQKMEEVTELKVFFTEEVLRKKIEGSGMYEVFFALSQDMWGERTVKDGLIGFARKCFKIQAPADKAEYCPWRSDIRSMLSSAINQGHFDLSQKNDQDVFVRLLKDFGPVNIPNTFRIMLELSRSAAASELPDNSQSDLRSFGIDLDKYQRPSDVLNQLKTLRRKILSDLLKEEVPSNLNSALGTEIFKSQIGFSRWKTDVALSTIAAAVVETSNENPDLFVIPEGYKIKGIKVRKTVNLDAAQESELTKRMNDFLNEAKTREAVENNVRPIAGAIDQGRRNDLSAWWENSKKNLRATVQEALDKMRSGLEKVPEKGKAKMQEKINSTEGFLTFLNEYKFPEDIKEEDILKSMEAFNAVSIKGRKELQDALRTLASYHMLQTMPEGQKEALNELFEKYPNMPEEDLIQGLDGFVSDFLIEHYFDPTKDPTKTYHQEFSSNLFKTLKGVFNLTGDVKKRPIRNIAANIEAILAGETTLSRETINTRLVPVKGLLRSYSGEISDACYSSKALNFAKGDFSMITSILFVTNPETPHERFDGAMLLIETEGEDGEKTMLVRANNPTQRLLYSCDGKKLIEESLQYAIEVAKERGFDRVVVPLSAPTRASSNRKDVSDYYFEKYGSAKKIQLKRGPETDFNNYQVWNSNGSDPSVEIWHS
ncbi:hypothetical protein KKC60_04190, partial [Patescibacteria group bacterium]|nr:hypothetical protein [Patescibacteria group bacterium]